MNPTNLSQETKVIIRALLLVFICFLVVESVNIIISWSNPPADSSNLPSIVVSGQGKAFSTPSAAEFSFSVDETASSVSVAQTKATNLTNNALNYLKTQNIPDKDIQTTSYSINPHYGYSNTICNSTNVSSPVSSSVSPGIIVCPPEKQIIDGYEVSQTVNVTLPEASTSGIVLAGIGNLGVQNVSGLSFTVPDQNAVESQARTAAIADAQSKAKTLAGELGVRLVRVISFQESNNNPFPIYASASAPSVLNALSIPQIPVGQNTVTSNVTITYEIK